MRRLTLSLAVAALLLTAFVQSYTWTKLPGSARDIAASAAGRIAVIGTNQINGGFEVYTWTGSDWKIVAGAAGVRVAIDGSNRLWVVNDKDEIWMQDGGTWKRQPGSAKDIACGADGTVYAIGTVAFPGGYKVYQWTGGNWQEVPGQGGVRISVDNQGMAWVVTDKGSIHQRVGNLWRAYPGSATDIGIGPKGEAWVVGDGGRIYQWVNGGWNSMNGTAVAIAVSQNNKAHIVNKEGEVYRID